MRIQAAPLTVPTLVGIYFHHRPIELTKSIPAQSMLSLLFRPWFGLSGIGNRKGRGEVVGEDHVQLAGDTQWLHQRPGRICS